MTKIATKIARIPSTGNALTGLEAHTYHSALDLAAKFSVRTRDGLERIAAALEHEARLCNDELDRHCLNMFAALARDYARKARF